MCGDLMVRAIRNVMGVAIAFLWQGKFLVRKNALPELSRGPWGIFLPLGVGLIVNIGFRVIRVVF